MYLAQYVFRINDENVNPKVSKAGHKSLALPLKCLESFQSLVQEADSHFHYEGTANRKRHQRSCMFNALQHLQKSQSKMPRFSNLEFLFANAKYHWFCRTWNTETCNKKCHKYWLAWEKQLCLKRTKKAALSRLHFLKAELYHAQALRRVPLFSCCRAEPPHRGRGFKAGMVLKAPSVLDSAWRRWGAPSVCSQSDTK